MANCANTRSETCIRTRQKKKKEKRKKPTSPGTDDGTGNKKGTVRYRRVSGCVFFFVSHGLGRFCTVLLTSTVRDE